MFSDQTYQMGFKSLNQGFSRGQNSLRRKERFQVVSWPVDLRGLFEREGLRGRGGVRGVKQVDHRWVRIPGISHGPDTGVVAETLY